MSVVSTISLSIFIAARVAMRALGFDMKKADVLKLLREHDKDGRGLMEFDDFQRISKFL